MAALVVFKPFRICLERPLKNRKGKFEHAFSIGRLKGDFQLQLSMSRLIFSQSILKIF